MSETVKIKGKDGYDGQEYHWVGKFAVRVADKIGDRPGSIERMAIMLDVTMQQEPHTHHQLLLEAGDAKELANRILAKLAQIEDKKHRN